ncbi:hypothetical protein HanXRQr2_Chr08g0327111 [Helianthus annuus]|uniref:Uncharacterized protein n=1 Tax=Helianthus annuus TaxID=4232 RepID=A0A9K3ID28_HELAN|nr:hypothetical protein HanXRQr2_Chr08g0327111 [Helianthus annuus]
MLIIKLGQHPLNKLGLCFIHKTQINNQSYEYSSSLEQLRSYDQETLGFIHLKCSNLISKSNISNLQASHCQAFYYTTNHKPFHNNQN